MRIKLEVLLNKRMNWIDQTGNNSSFKNNNAGKETNCALICIAYKIEPTIPIYKRGEMD